MKAFLSIALATSLLAPPLESHANRVLDSIESNLEGESLQTLSQSSVVNDSYSRSALGFSTFVIFAEQLGYPVHRVKDPYSVTFDEQSAVVLLEPVVHPNSSKEVIDAYRWYLENAETIILVLPKRVALQTNALGTQLRETGLVDLYDLWKLTEPVYWFSGLERVSDRPHWAQNLEIDSLQVASTPDATTFERIVHVGDEQTALVIEGDSPRYRRLIIVTDPDVFANHGIVKGDNAEVAAKVLGLLEPGTRLYVDEALHGYWNRYSLWKALRSFPAVLVLGSLALFGFLFIWRRQTSAARSKRAQVATNPQVAVLERSADMIAHVIPSRRSVDRLRAAFVRDAISRGGLRKMTEADAILRLESLRKPAHSLAALDARRTQQSRMSAAAARRLATQYQQWYREVTHGT